jgi:hypothetical protein
MPGFEQAVIAGGADEFWIVELFGTRTVDGVVATQPEAFRQPGGMPHQRVVDLDDGSAALICDI